jgi:hypothetical protein
MLTNDIGPNCREDFPNDLHGREKRHKKGLFLPGPGSESGNQRPKRRKDKLIRIDDLIPKQDVKGGRQLPFGVSDTTQTTNPTKES